MKHQEILFEHHEYLIPLLKNEYKSQKLEDEFYQPNEEGFNNYYKEYYKPLITAQIKILDRSRLNSWEKCHLSRILTDEFNNLRSEFGHLDLIELSKMSELEFEKLAFLDELKKVLKVVNPEKYSKSSINIYSCLIETAKNVFKSEKFVFSVGAKGIYKFGFITEHNEYLTFRTSENFSINQKKFSVIQGSLLNFLRSFHLVSLSVEEAQNILRLNDFEHKNEILKEFFQIKFN